VSIKTATKWKVPLFDLDLGEKEYKSVKGVLDSKWLTMGQVTKDFESAFADYLGVKHAMAVSSGTAAMHLAHHAIGFKKGDEVICPSLSFVATANAILYTGAKSVFADITSFDDLTISPDDVESRINERTRGIVVVHYAGFPCDMDRIMDVARNHSLFVIEDAAHAAGAEYSARGIAHSAGRPIEKDDGQRTTDNAPPRTVNCERPTANTQQPTNNAPPSMVNGQRSTANRLSRKLGTIGDIGCFSFFSNKNMTTAEGGMVVTNSDDLAEKIRIGRSHGMTSLTWDRYEGPDFSYDVVGPGFNYRIDELRSSLGLVQLNKLDKNNSNRRALWTLYAEQLNNIEEIKVPFSDTSRVSSYHIFPVLLSENMDRKGLMEYLREQGIQTSVHYPPIHLFSYYRELLPSDAHLPLTEYVGRREVTLPLFPTMTEEQVEYVVNAIKDYLARH
jgi:dTDP-4-amino-4,6-dideoxygalactose transaminase